MLDKESSFPKKSETHLTERNFIREKCQVLHLASEQSTANVGLWNISVGKYDFRVCLIPSQTHRIQKFESTLQMTVFKSLHNSQVTDKGHAVFHANISMTLSVK
jgi:hypothetical protein